LFDDEGKTFTGHNADYTYYDVPNAYEGTIILITTPERFSEMPEDMQNEFEYQTGIVNIRTVPKLTNL